MNIYLVAPSLMTKSKNLSEEKNSPVKEADERQKKITFASCQYTKDPTLDIFELLNISDG
ncbi:MAG: hypothetical protein WC606_03640 [Candidatus Absconditabacterales bacterium]|jgi:hypothetical protein